MTTRRLTVQIVGDSRSVERMFGRVGDEASTLGGSVRAGIATASRALTGLAVVGGGAAFSLANTAADLSEAQSKANQVFGEGAGAVSDFAQTAADDFGLSERAATDAASSFGQLLKTSDDLDPSQIAAMAGSLTGLTGDLASFNNLATDDVAQKLFAGLSGETEPLKRMGILFNAAAVEAKALELGLGDASGAVSESAKIQARYALIMEQTADAQGDFARTADGLPNQQRAMVAQWENLRATIGEGLAPVFASLIGAISDNMPRMVEWFGQAVTAGERLADAVRGIVGPVAAFVEANDLLVPGLAAAGAVVAAVVVPAVVSMAAAWIVAAAPIIAAGAAIAALAAGVVWAYRNVEQFRVIVDAGFAAIKAAAVAVFSAVTAAADAVVGWWRDNWPQIRDITLAVFSAVSGVVVETFETIRGWFAAFIETAQGLWARFGDNIVTTLTNAWALVAGVVTAGLDVIRALWATFSALFRGDWSGLWDGLKALAEAGLGLAWAAVSGGFTLIKDAVAGAVTDMAAVVGDKVGEVVAWFTGMPGRVVEAVGDLASTLVSKGRDLITGLWDGLKAVFGIGSSGGGGGGGGTSTVLGWVRQVPALLAAAVGALGSVLFSKGRDLITGLWDGAKSVWSAFSGWLDGIAGTIESVLSGVSGAIGAVGGAIGLGGGGGGTTSYGTTGSIWDPSAGTSIGAWSDPNELAGFGITYNSITVENPDPQAVVRAIDEASATGYGGIY